jgi:hypothetical protein
VAQGNVSGDIEHYLIIQLQQQRQRRRRRQLFPNSVAACQRKTRDFAARKESVAASTFKAIEE